MENKKHISLTIFIILILTLFITTMIVVIDKYARYNLTKENLNIRNIICGNRYIGFEKLSRSNWYLHNGYFINRKNNRVYPISECKDMRD